MKKLKLDLFGEGAVFDHVGLATASIDEDFPGLDRVMDPIQRVTVGFLDVHGVAIEAVEPAEETSPVSNQLKKGCKLLHLCYRVPDLEAAIATARKRGLMPIAKPVPAKAFGNRRIAWLYSRTLGLFELLEAERTASS